MTLQIKVLHFLFIFLTICIYSSAGIAKKPMRMDISSYDLTQKSVRNSVSQRAFSNRPSRIDNLPWEINCTNTERPSCSNGLLKFKPDDETLFFRYAEIPDIVFIEGYTDKENMGIYMLNPNNLYPKGGTHWLTGAGWNPVLQSIIQGDLPTGVSFDENTGKLHYDGSQIDGDIEKIITLHQPDTNQTSIEFKVKVLEPDVIWGSDDTITFHEAVSRLPATGNGVLLIKGGEYNYTKLHGNNSWIGGGQKKEALYIIGEPDNRPQLNVPDADGKNFNLTFMTKDNKYIYYKNLDIERGKLSAADYTVYNNIFLHDFFGGDSITGSNTSGQRASTVFISNIEMTRCGSDSVYHCIYLHGITEADDGIAQKAAYINNLKAYEMIGGNKSFGGITVKSLSDITKLRNFWISQWRDPSQPDIGKTSRSNPINIGEFTKTTIFNGVMWTDPIAILFPNRNMASAGNMNPRYFSTDYNQIYPMSEVSGIKSEAFHGENASHTYTATGEVGGIEPAPDWEPVNAPFWDMIGDPSDPENTKLTFQKYISFVEFNPEGGTLTNGTSLHNTGIDTRGTAPNATVAKFTSMFDRLPAPPNWKERSHVFAANNIFNGYNQTKSQFKYRIDFKEPIRYIYPYAPDPDVPRGLTHLGGDIDDGEGSFVQLPSWFKI